MKLLRKVSSFLRLLRQSSQPWSALRLRLQENAFQVRSWLHGGKPFQYRAAPGFPFACIPSSSSSRQLYLHGYQEELEAAAVLRWLRPGDVCLDVGANVGYFACLFAAHVGAQGKVIALEPGGATFDHLRAAASLLDLPQLAMENACALDEERTVRFMVANSDEVDCEQSMRVDQSQKEQFREIYVDGTTVNSVVRRHDVMERVSLVKIDVEGAEPLVLKGAHALFHGSAIPLFIVEIHQLALKNFGQLPADVLAFFPLETFSCYAIPRSVTDATPERQHGVAYRLDYPDKFDWPVYSNLVAVPRHGAFAERAKELTALLDQGTS